MNRKHTIYHICILLIGLGLIVSSFFGKVDEFWSGMGGALIGVGAMRLVQILRYRNNEAYRENVDTERNDERNQFLHMKAWQLTAGWFVIIAAIGTFVFKFTGREDLMMLCSWGVCLMITLYWVCYLYLKKKY